MLIAGGGPAGLTLAITLGQLGVRCEVVDARPAPARVPGADRCGSGAMEIFRRLGLSGQLRSAGLPADAPLDVLVCAQSLARPVARHRYPQVAEVLAAGLEVNDGTMPLEPPVILSQYTLEPLLREAAEATPGVTVRFGAELIDFALVGGGVTAMVQTGSRLRTFRADYLVGCDGAGSTVRSVLGIELRGRPRPAVRQALIYCPDLYERLPAGRAIQYHVVGDHPCTLVVQDDTQHFVLHAPGASSGAPGVSPASGVSLGALFEAVAGPHVRGRYKILHEGEWAQHLLLAERYDGAGHGRGGDRVLLAGDAAHPACTTGGLGLSIAVGDAADLAWKLAATLEGWGGPALLRSYETERRPVAAQAIAASLAAADADGRWYADLPLLEHGYRYTGSPVIAPAAGTAPAPALAFAPAAAPALAFAPAAASAYGPALAWAYGPGLAPARGLAPGEVGGAGGAGNGGAGGAGNGGAGIGRYRHAATTWPGARLPHIWLDDGTPLHDLLWTGFTLLYLPGPTDSGVVMYARELASAFGRLGAPLDLVEVTATAAQAVYAGHRLILVRPDLHVAWRSGDSQPDAAALAALVTGNGHGGPSAGNGAGPGWADAGWASGAGAGASATFGRSGTSGTGVGGPGASGPDAGWRGASGADPYSSGANGWTLPVRTRPADTRRPAGTADGALERLLREHFGDTFASTAATRQSGSRRVAARRFPFGPTSPGTATLLTFGAFHKPHFGIFRTKK